MSRAITTTLFTLCCPSTAIALFALIRLARAAPLGWEDEHHGFTYGDPGGNHAR